MTTPEPEPRLPADEHEELIRYAGHRAEPADPDRQVGPTEPRPPIVSALGLWWVPMAGLVVGLLFIATDHMWRAGASMAASLWLAAALRAILPERAAGGLVVRHRGLDVAVLLLAGGLVALSAFTLDLQDLRR